MTKSRREEKLSSVIRFYRFYRRTKFRTKLKEDLQQNMKDSSNTQDTKDKTYTDTHTHTLVFRINRLRSRQGPNQLTTSYTAATPHSIQRFVSFTTMHVFISGSTNGISNFDESKLH